MKIIEQFIEGKKSQATCEDGIVVTDNFFAVVDGSTSKTPFRLDEHMTNGQFAMRLITNYIEHASSQGDISVETFCENITEQMGTAYQQRGVIEQMRQHPEMRPTASAIIYNKVRREIWMIGDCQALVDGALYENPKPYERAIAQKRVDLIREGMTPAEARKAIEPLLVKAMEEGQNKQYAVIDGFAIYMPGVKVIPTIKAQTEIVLASDGYPFLEPTLEKSEEALRHQLEKDPQNVDTFLATKGLVAGNVSFDDRAYVRFMT